MLSESLAFEMSILSSVSSLNDTTNARGTHKLTKGASNFGTSCKDIVGAPPSDGILCVGYKQRKITTNKQFKFKEHTICFDGT